jgi:hypothetical protein
MGNGNFEYAHNVIASKNQWGCYMDITKRFMIAWVILATINNSKIKVFFLKLFVAKMAIIHYPYVDVEKVAIISRRFNQIGL